MQQASQQSSRKLLKNFIPSLYGFNILLVFLMLLYRYVSIVLFGAMLIGCGGGYGIASALSVSSPSECSVAEEKQYIFDVLNDSYLWSEDIPDVVDLSIYTDANEVLRELTSQTGKDRFSFILSKQKNSLFVSGRRKGIGITYARDPQTSAIWLTHVVRGSPAWTAGMRRGDQLQQIDGQIIETAPIIVSTGSMMTWLKGGVTEQVGFVVPDEFAVPTVYADKVIDLANGQKALYFAYSTFLDSSKAEIESLMDRFQGQQYESLIIDLRDNGGGSVNIAANLASKISGIVMAGGAIVPAPSASMPAPIVGASPVEPMLAPAGVPEQKGASFFAKLKHNLQYSSFDYNIPFIYSLSQLEPKQIIVLTNKATCSASELIINGLRPFIKVVTVGGQTCGKPLAMRAKPFCGSVLYALDAELVNVDNVGRYFDGIPADCAVTSRQGHDWGDVSDPVITAALQYAVSGVCPSEVADEALVLKRSAGSPSLSETDSERLPFKNQL